MRFNINDSVRVKLTDAGRAIHRQQHDELAAYVAGLSGGHKFLSYAAPKEDADGWSTWSLWVLMQTFGPRIHMVGELPFETDIEIPDNQAAGRKYNVAEIDALREALSHKYLYGTYTHRDGQCWSRSHKEVELLQTVERWLHNHMNLGHTVEDLIAYETTETARRAG